MRTILVVAALGLFMVACGKTETADMKSVFSVPTGEHAHYVVDKSRTMREVREGQFGVEIGAYNSTDNTYEITASYSLNIILLGWKNGTEVMPVNADYWTPEFWESLRKTGHYVNRQYKIDHLGYADAVTMEGKTFPNSDKLKIYDIKLDNADADLSKVTVVALVNMESIPAFGGAKFDVSGSVDGRQIKLGADYKSCK